MRNIGGLNLIHLVPDLLVEIDVALAQSDHVVLDSVACVHLQIANVKVERGQQLLGGFCEVGSDEDWFGDCFKSKITICQIYYSMMKIYYDYNKRWLTVLTLKTIEFKL